MAWCFKPEILRLVLYHDLMLEISCYEFLSSANLYKVFALVLLGTPLMNGRIDLLHLSVF